MAKPETTGSRMGGLDALRFVAAMAVLASHYVFSSGGIGLHDGAVYWASFGGYGVHIFFVISGYVILTTATRTNASEFFAGRFARLLPTFAICAAITAIALSIEGKIDVSLSMYLANLTLVADKLGFDYIDGVYWTLSFEAFFYFFVFVLLLTGHFRLLLRPALVAWLALCALYAAGFFRDGLRTYFIASYAPLFILGICLYLVTAERSRLGWAVGIVAMIIAVWNEIGLIIGRLADPTSEVPAAAIAVAVMVIVGAPFVVWAASKIKAPWRWLTILGGVSYPLYLLHAQIGRVVFDMAPWFRSGWGVACVTLGIVVVSWVIFALDDIARPHVRRAVRAIVTWPRGIFRSAGSGEPRTTHR